VGGEWSHRRKRIEGEKEEGDRRKKIKGKGEGEIMITTGGSKGELNKKKRLLVHPFESAS